PWGMSWGPDGIVFADPVKGVTRVAANGGKPELLIPLKPNEVLYGPQILPDGQSVLFTVAPGSQQWDTARIVVESLKSHERKTVIESGSDARYIPSGHIVYAVGGVLFAAPFDVRRLELSGGAAPVVEGVRRAAGTPAAFFSVSGNGSLVFAPGPVSA